MARNRRSNRRLAPARARSPSRSSRRARLTHVKRMSPSSDSTRPVPSPPSRASRSSAISSSSLSNTPSTSGQSKPAAAARRCSFAARARAGSAAGSPSSALSDSRTFPRLRPLPVRPLPVPGSGRIEYVRVAANHLVHDRVDDVLDIETPPFIRQMGVKHYLKQQVTQFFAKRVEVLARDRVGDLVRFLDGAGNNRLESLGPVPGAVLPEPGHQSGEAFHLFLRRAGSFAGGRTRGFRPLRAGRSGCGYPVGLRVRAPSSGSVRARRSVIFLLLGAILPATFLEARAVPAEPPVSRAAIERIMVLEARSALRRGERTRFTRLAKALRNHPLHPWLKYLEFRRRFGRHNESAIEAFLATVPDTPMADLVRGLWLDRLARQHRWARFLQVHSSLSPGRMETRRECLHARALLETGNDTAGFEATARLWRVPRSQHKACDRTFALWARKGGRTSEHLWHRIEISLKRGNRGLASFVARMLDQPDRAIAERWVREYRRPARIVARAAPTGPARATVGAAGRHRHRLDRPAHPGCRRPRLADRFGGPIFHSGPAGRLRVVAHRTRIRAGAPGPRGASSGSNAFRTKTEANASSASSPCFRLPRGDGRIPSPPSMHCPSRRARNFAGGTGAPAPSPPLAGPGKHRGPRSPQSATTTASWPPTGLVLPTASLQHPAGSTSGAHRPDRTHGRIPARARSSTPSGSGMGSTVNGATSCGASRART